VERLFCFGSSYADNNSASGHIHHPYPIVHRIRNAPFLILQHHDHALRQFGAWSRYKYWFPGGSRTADSGGELGLVDSLTFIWALFLLVHGDFGVLLLLS